jgi:hypothetical protein
MSPTDFTLIIAALGSFFAILGGGAKWLMSHIDAKAKESELRENEARIALSNRLQEEISSLRRDLSRVLEEKSLFMRRIYVLESFIHNQEGISIPPMEGWPPK